MFLTIYGVEKSQCDRSNKHNKTTREFYQVRPFSTYIIKRIEVRTSKKF